MLVDLGEFPHDAGGFVDVFGFIGFDRFRGLVEEEGAEFLDLFSLEVLGPGEGSLGLKVLWETLPDEGEEGLTLGLVGFRGSEETGNGLGEVLEILEAVGGFRWGGLTGLSNDLGLGGLVRQEPGHEVLGGGLSLVVWIHRMISGLVVWGALNGGCRARVITKAR